MIFYSSLIYSIIGLIFLCRKILHLKIVKALYIEIHEQSLNMKNILNLFSEFRCDNYLFFLSYFINYILKMYKNNFKILIVQYNIQIDKKTIKPEPFKKCYLLEYCYETTSSVTQVSMKINY